MCSFKHTIVPNVGCDCVKPTEGKKESISLKQAVTTQTSSVSAIEGLSLQATQQQRL